MEFTLPQIDGALAAIDRRERRERLTRVYDMRAAQADAKGFREYLKNLRQEARLREARRRGQRLPQRGPRTPDEIRVWSNQPKAFFRDMPPKERARIERQQAAMWGSIPAHMREKAKGYAEGH